MLLMSSCKDPAGVWLNCSGLLAMSQGYRAPPSLVFKCCRKEGQAPRYLRFASLVDGINISLLG